jgi:hypothetical protein
MQLFDDILDMKIDGRLRNPQTISNLLVAVTFLNQAKHVELPTGEIFFTKMLGKTGPGTRLRPAWTERIASSNSLFGMLFRT